jgi:hypothetical protein
MAEHVIFGLIRKKVEVWVADLEGNWVYGYI